MKRVILGLFLCCLMTANACTAVRRPAETPFSTAEAPVLERILQKGELVVGMSGNQPPLNAKTRDGEVIGLEPDLSRAMAGAMEVDLKLLTMPFAELLPALQAGRVDMIISGMTMTPKRNMTVAFVGPYFISGKALLTKSRKFAMTKDSGEIDNPRTTLVALRGSTSQIFVEKNVPRAKLVLTKNYDEAVDMVIKGTVDAMVADLPFCVVSVLRHPEENLKTLVAPLTFEPLGIALPGHDPLLVNWVHNFLIMAEGT